MVTVEVWEQARKSLVLVGGKREKRNRKTSSRPTDSDIGTERRGKVTKLLCRRKKEVSGETTEDQALKSGKSAGGLVVRVEEAGGKTCLEGCALVKSREKGKGNTWNGHSQQSGGQEGSNKIRMMPSRAKKDREGTCIYEERLPEVGCGPRD